MDKLYVVYRLVKQTGARKLRLWRYAAVASSPEQAIVRTMEENHGCIVLPEEERCAWHAIPSDSHTVGFGLVLIEENEILPSMRDAWAESTDARRV